MKDEKLTRRDFVRNTSIVAAGAVMGSLAGKVRASSNRGRPVDTSRILNYNPDMEYRRLGKTNLMVSAVCLGGHWKRVDVMKQDFAQNRY
ncbi:MAG: twin-arginine translocation signal domain-containing protein, partial [Planctomycetota bacterium]